MEEQSNQFVIDVKTVTLGSSGVGKSSIMRRAVTGCFSAVESSTSGAAFLRYSLKQGATTFKFAIFDTAGQERFRSLSCIYYRSAAAIVLVYDVTRRATFDDVAYWVKELRTNLDREVVLVLAANKIDKAGRVVTEEEGRQYAAQINAYYIETSAQSGEGVQEIFGYISQQNVKSRQTAPSFIEEVEKPKQKPSGCC